MSLTKRGERGIQRDVKNSLELVTEFENEEDVGTIGADNIDLTIGTLGDGTNGVGDGTSRTGLRARSFHNYSSTDSTLTYRLVGDGAITRTAYIPAGQDKHMWQNVAIILGTGSGTTVGLWLKVYYKDKSVVDDNGPVPA